MMKLLYKKSLKFFIVHYGGPTLIKKLQKKIIELAYNAKEGHIASSLSVLDIIYVLYHSHNMDNKNPDRPRFILSKGHASLALYTVLNDVNIIPDNILNTYCQFNSALGGHPKRSLELGIEASTGSLGHGFPIAIGIALGYKILGYKSNIYCLIGDGECNEGTIWESALLASQHKLNNLYLIVDYNHSNDRALRFNDLLKQFESFGFYGYLIDGHNHNELNYFLKDNTIYKYVDKPKIIIAVTTKGHGIKRMENNPEWHHKIPNETEYKEIMEELCQ